MTQASAPNVASWPHETALCITSTMVIGTAAMLVLGLQPILLGGLAEAGRLTEAEVGRAAMIEIFGLAIGPFFINSGYLRIKAGAIAVLLVLINLAFFGAGSSLDIILQRGAAGLLEGLLLSSVAIILTHTRRPERMNGVLLGVSTFPQMVAVYVLSTSLIPLYGLGAGFILLAVAAAVALLAVVFVVDRVETGSDSALAPVQWSPSLVVFVGGVLLQNAGIGAAWNYGEILARQHGFDHDVVGLSMSGGLGFQVIGALLAAWLAHRLHHRSPLILGTVVQAGIVYGMTIAAIPGAYIALCCAFGLFWLALQPFQVIELIKLDPSRTMAVLLTPLALTGLSIGPLLVSFVANENSVSAVFFVAAALLVGGALLYAFSLRLFANARVNAT
jgi:hypothetical protein